jgi:hypothetical protein
MQSEESEDREGAQEEETAEEQEEEEKPSEVRSGRQFGIGIFRWYNSSHYRQPKDRQPEKAVAATVKLMEGATKEAMEESGADQFNFAGYCGTDKRTKEEILEQPFITEVNIAYLETSLITL